MKIRLGESASIVNSPSLETGLVKIQRNELLNASERAACIPFKEQTQSVADVSGGTEDNSIVQQAFKRRRVQRRTQYMDVSFVPPTSNECERFFSAVKLQLTDLRKCMDIYTIEMVMMLSYNRDIWDVYTVEMIRTNTVEH